MHNMNVKRSLLVICLIGFFVNMVPISYAASMPKVVETIKAKETADIVEAFIDKEEVGSIEDIGDKYVDNSGEVNTSIPKNGDGYITMESEDIDTIGMSLPLELNMEEGIATDNGTIVYRTDNSVEVCVQSITSEQDKTTIDGVRVLTAINDEHAPKEYSFDFELPKGYSLIKAEEYWKNNNMIENDISQVNPSSVYIVNENDEIQSVIDAPWARDSKGKKVETSYKIDGLTLTQHISFDKNSSFPIVADPSSHPTKYKTITLVVKKSEKKKLRKLIYDCIKKVKATNGGLFEVLLQTAGLFNIGIGFASNVYSGAVGSNRNFLIQKQTVYTEAYLEFDGKKPPKKVGIYEKCRGVWQGGRKSAYYWKSISVSWKRL